MSIKVMTYVWDNSKEVKGTELLCLLALADWCNDEGFCYPGIKRLAEKCRINERGIQKVLASLVKQGELKIAYNQGKHINYGSTNRYYLTKYREFVGEPDPFAEVAHRTSPPRPVGHPPPVLQDTTPPSHRTPDPSVLTVNKKPSVSTRAIGDENGNDDPRDETAKLSFKIEKVDPALEELRFSIGEKTFDRFLGGAKLLRVEADVAVIQIQDGYAKDWIENRLRNKIMAAFKVKDMKCVVKSVAT